MLTFFGCEMIFVLIFCVVCVRRHAVEKRRKTTELILIRQDPKQIVSKPLHSLGKDCLCAPPASQTARNGKEGDGDDYTSARVSLRVLRQELARMADDERRKQRCDAMRRDVFRLIGEDERFCVRFRHWRLNSHRATSHSS